MAARPILVCLLAVLALVPIGGASAATVTVAVAANFTATARELAAAFVHETGNTLQLSFGSSGALYAQISQGAPYEVFLSADTARPAQAVSEGYAVGGTAFTYALGELVLYSPHLDLINGAAVLKAGAFAHLAIADPRTAPYGAAAIETLDSLGLHSRLAPKLVIGESVAQTLQFVASGNAELGFVALSEVMGREGSVWRVPAELHNPIEQGAVLLHPGRNDPAARAFLAFLKGPAARRIIRDAGYGVPE